ncbi:Metalloprotease [Mycena kentingensis (nom. inval.)]|nr:Metalloprotease [Mycena kentingensis (nom. inval.)]
MYSILFTVALAAPIALASPLYHNEVPFQVPALRNTTLRCGSVISSAKAAQLEAIFNFLLKETQPSTSSSSARTPAQTSSTSAAQPSSTPIANINVFWHKIVDCTRTSKNGDIAETQIVSQIDVLNADYRGMFTFKLASIDRTCNTTQFNEAGPENAQQTEMKTKDTSARKGSKHDLNVWTVGFDSGDAAGLLGYATFPASYATDPSDDGVVLLYSTLPGGSTTNYDQGKTLTHETGHWLGLYHTFQGGCSDTTGDYVKDTPAEASPASGCQTGRDTCPNLPGKDPVSNYMDYSDDSCSTLFTSGQAERMKMQWGAFRA